MKSIDLRSDTVTQPSPEMRKAMAAAEVGDDGYGDDPTLNGLQERMANLLGKPKALFVPTGTMGNLVSVLTHCGRGEQVILGANSHHATYEQGGSSALGGISTRTVPNLADGRLDWRDIESSINPDDDHFARTKLICIENTWNGHPLSVAYTEELRSKAAKHGLKIHLDGARLFNAAIALNVNIKELVRDVDSVQVCFSKGLACPAGSIVAGAEQFIYEARRARHILGGRMRQTGILAAACLVALESMVDRLKEDHANALLLAEGLSQIPGIAVSPSAKRTNMVFFHAQVNCDPAELLAKFKESGVKMGWAGASRGFRAVTHYGIDSSDIECAVERIKGVLAFFPPCHQEQMVGANTR